MWFDSSECRYTGREVERILYAYIISYNIVHCELGFYATCLKTVYFLFLLLL